MLQRARDEAKTGDLRRAVDLYHKALERKPNLARAHLELGLLHDKQLDEYLRAIYHYERYLEMRPEAEKREMVEELIRYAKIAYAATLPDQSSDAVEAIADLRAEIGRLKAELARAVGKAPPPAPPRAAATAPRPGGRPLETARPAAPRPAPAQPAVETYTVRAGDTLSRIAAKVYNDPRKWRIIYDANRNILSSPESLRQDQTLVIPNI